MLASYRRFRDRTVRVHTPSASIEGVLIYVSRDYFLLRGAKFVSGEDEALSLDGDAVLPRSADCWLQVL